ncbi:MAG: XRE family transcriptional regulator [Acidimicrobiia bacterium]|nr:XRE family transcriptional regulator [Acidimicrobiia bacterium]
MDGDEMAVTLGRKLRKRRKSQGLTLQQLADLCGLSQPFLSQLENGKATPSLMALHQVAAALGTSAQVLLQPDTTNEVSLVRGAEARCYQLGEGATARFLVERAHHHIEANLITVEHGAESGSHLSHDGEETVYVLDGSISVDLDGYDAVDLEVGDAYTYPSTRPHGWRNIGKGTAQFLFISSPPSF